MEEIRISSCYEACGKMDQLVQLVRKISCFNNNSRCFKISTPKIAGDDSF